MSRLEGDVANLKEVVNTLAPLTAQTAVLTQKIVDLDDDMGDIRDEFRLRVEKLQTTVEHDRDDRRRDAATQALERKRDRHWAVGAIMTATALIIAATGVIVSVLT